MKAIYIYIYIYICISHRVFHWHGMPTQILPHSSTSLHIQFPVYLHGERPTVPGCMKKNLRGVVALLKAQNKGSHKDCDVRPSRLWPKTKNLQNYLFSIYLLCPAIKKVICAIQFFPKSYLVLRFLSKSWGPHWETFTGAGPTQQRSSPCLWPAGVW